MPIYEYACEKCGNEFEAEQRITDAPIKVCPRCRSRRVKRLISQTSFVLKGSGWYSDLYASKKDAKADTKEAGGSGETSPADAKPASDGAAAEAKPAAADGKKKGPSKKKGKKAAA